MPLAPDPGCRAQTGLSVPPIRPVCGDTLLPFSKGNRGVGPLQALELDKEMASHHFRAKP